MWLSDASIKQPVLVTMVVVAAIIIGAISYSRMGVDLFPDVSFPVVAITTTLPGASPEEVETQVTKPIEDSLASLPNLDSLRSTSTEGASTIIVQFKLESSLDEGVNKIRDQIGLIKGRLPTDTTDPVVLRFDPSAQPILVYALSTTDQSMSPLEFSRFVDDHIKPELERLDGVGQVRISGQETRQVQVNLHLDALRARNLSAQEVTAALRTQNLSLPGGRLSQGNQDLTLKTTGEFQNVSEIAQLVVAQRNGVPIILRDIATVVDGTAERRQFSRLNSQNSVTITVQKQSGSNTVKVADKVAKQVALLQQRTPGLTVALVRDESELARESNQDVTLAIVLGSVFASLVVLLFFRDLRNTLVTVAGLPTIIMATFWAISLLGYTINMMTLMALSLSIGLLIDDAIVVRENIFRRMETGEDPKSAASLGTKEIAFAVLATSLTVLAVFIPVAFTSGVIGQFFRQFGITVAMSVIISTIEAFTLAPMLSAYFFKRIETARSEGRNPQRSRLERFYAGLTDRYNDLLEWALRHRLHVVAIGVAAFIGSLALVPFIGVQFFGQDDAAYFGISTEMPPGTSLAETDFTARHVESVLLDQPEVTSVYTTVGSASASGLSAGAEQASFFVNVKNRNLTKRVAYRMRQVLAGTPGIAFSNQPIGGGGTSSALAARTVLLNISGSDSLDALERVSRELMDKMATIPGLIDLDRSYKPGKPEILVRADREKAADLGVNVSAAATTLRTMITGDTVSKLREGNRETDIMVRLAEQDRTRLRDILSTTIPSSRGAAVPLSSIVKVENASGPTQISRENRQPLIQVGANVRGRPESEVTQAVLRAQSELHMPQGVTIAFAGNSRQSAESFGALLTALVMAIVFVYMVLASQFGSFIHPFTIMLSLPLALGGALVALLLSGKPLDVMGMIGIILLMGLVTKNAILLVDFILQARRAGMTRTEAILRAGPIRLRPILMTTLAMIAGMLPIALGLGAGSGWRAPMAITVIGGLITSTMLTLVVIPVVYTLVDDAQSFFARRRARAREPQPLPVMAGDAIMTERSGE